AHLDRAEGALQPSRSRQDGRTADAPPGGDEDELIGHERFAPGAVARQASAHPFVFEVEDLLLHAARGHGSPPSLRLRRLWRLPSPRRRRSLPAGEQPALFTLAN